MNLADLEKKERGFLLDAPVSPSELLVPPSIRWSKVQGGEGAVGGF